MGCRAIAIGLTAERTVSAMAFSSFHGIGRGNRCRGSQKLTGALRAASMTAHKSGDPLTLNRLYGRSSGHKLRPGQQELVERLLPEIEVPGAGDINAVRLFGEDRPLHLEIGFGSGEHLADRADMLPDHGF